MKIHYDLIGTIPAVECFRMTLDELILRYEMEAPRNTPEFGLMSKTDMKLYINEAFKNPAALQRMADGVAIEMCAQHFYGFSPEDFNSMTELIDAINSYDEDLRFK